MDRIKAFIKTSVLGGLAVILPAIFLFLIFRWLFNWITGTIFLGRRGYPKVKEFTMGSVTRKVLNQDRDMMVSIVL